MDYTPQGFVTANSYDPEIIIFLVSFGVFLISMIYTGVQLEINARKRKQYESGDRETKLSIEQRLAGIEKRMTAIETLLIEEDRKTREEQWQSSSEMR